MLKNTLPVWLFSSLYNAEVNGLKGQRWGEEKELLGQRIIQKIEEVAKSQYWDKTVIERVLYINQHDDCNMY